ncbi:MAG: hexose kinase [Actinomycetota bacterium]|nr:hexose kinase [Actinomycetota bacterium]
MEYRPGPVILTVTLNAALDVTYRVDALRPHATHRVRDVHAVAGGKGVNVARVLAASGEDVMVTGLTGGVTGDRIRADLDDAGLPQAMVQIGGESRRTLAVHGTDDGDATLFNEPGPLVQDDEWASFRDSFADLAAAAEVVVLSGSLAPGLPPDAYASLVGLAAEHGATTVVDASGAALRAAVEAGAAVVKPNAAELAEVTGLDDPFAAVACLRDTGAGAVVASLGPDGVLALAGDGYLSARPPARVDGNPTGAGDACTAALARGLARGDAWPTMLAEAVALSAAAVTMPRAGEVDLDLAARFQRAVTVEQVVRR